MEWSVHFSRVPFIIITFDVDIGSLSYLALRSLAGSCLLFEQASKQGLLIYRVDYRISVHLWPYFSQSWQTRQILSLLNQRRMNNIEGYKFCLKNRQHISNIPLIDYFLYMVKKIKIIEAQSSWNSWVGRENWAAI